MAELEKLWADFESLKERAQTELTALNDQIEAAGAKLAKAEKALKVASNNAEAAAKEVEKVRVLAETPLHVQEHGAPGRLVWVWVGVE